MTGTSSASWPISPSLVPKRFHRIEPRGAPGRIEGRKEGKGECHDDDCRSLAEIDLCWQLGKEIELRRKQFSACEPGQELPDRFDVKADDQADKEAGESADHPDGSAGDQENPHDRTLGSTHRAQDCDV